MLDLRLIGVHEDGQHLLLADPEGNRYRVPLDEALRAAVRRDRPRLGQLQIETEGGMRPREVQALIRGGASAEEVAERAGWPVEKVRRYEGPILAEREHVAGLARQVRLRGRGGGQGSTPTLATRVSQRLSGRGVDPSAAEWDSARNEEGEWTVTLTFAAGGRQRQASWHFDVPARTVVAADDEARWLSEDDQPATNSPIPAPHLVATPVRATTVYDVEAEGGVAASARPRPSAAPERPSREEPLDLMTAMRERASARGRRSGGRRKSAPAQTPVDEAPREDALPLEDIAYDPETMPPPPAARGTHPADEPESVGDDVMPAAEDDGSEVPSSEPDVEPEPAQAREAQPEPEPEAAVSVEPEPETSEPEPAEVAPELEQPDAQEAGAEQGEQAEHEPAEVAPEPEQPDAQEAGAEQPEPEQPEPEQPQAEHEQAAPEAPKSDHAEKVEQPKPGPARPARKKGRPSVPSWDDVVFGARPRD